MPKRSDNSARQQEAAANSRPKVLIVDDQESLTEVMSCVLDRYGFDTLIAGHGERCLSLVRSMGDIRLVILDIGMPKVDGREVLATMKREGYLDKISVVILSGYAREARALANEYGLPHYLSKPCSPDQLKSVIGKVFKEHPFAVSASA